MYEQRQYMIFNVSELPLVDFNEVLETSEQTIRKSIDGTKTFVKWDGETIPPSVEALTTKDGPYNHSDILDIMITGEWTSNQPLI